MQRYEKIVGTREEAEVDADANAERKATLAASLRLRRSTRKEGRNMYRKAYVNLVDQ